MTSEGPADQLLEDELPVLYQSLWEFLKAEERGGRLSLPASKFWLPRTACTGRDVTTGKKPTPLCTLDV
ncbi:hypothetical protein LSAT2_030479 [Lamellibrachia satsuma]|nr:hypothetical protein LSAT2_030479 [Lamellibrachia satsuma]